MGVRRNGIIVRLAVLFTMTPEYRSETQVYCKILKRSIRLLPANFHRPVQLYVPLCMISLI